jgi:hypothetical protein
MALTLLQIVQNAQAELGLPQATSVISNTDPTTVQMFNLANRVLDEMRRMNPTGWSVLQNEFDIVVSVPIITTGNLTLNSPVITNIASGTAGLAAQYWQVSATSTPVAARILSVDSSSQVTMTMNATGASTGQTVTFAKDTYSYPTDYDWTQNRTQWDRTNRWELIGPDSPQFDQWHRSGIIATGPRRHFRRLGQLANKFRIWPAPAEIANPLQLVFEYLSINAVAVHGSATTFAQYFANDDDQPLLDDNAVVTGVKWMFWEIKGFNVQAMQSRWVDYVQQLIARDEGSMTLPLARRFKSQLLSVDQVQDSNWPGPSGPNMS